MSKKQTPIRVTRSGAFAPESFDAEARTVDIVFSSGPVSSFDRGDFREDLIVTEEAMITDRLDAGVVSLLVEHDWWGPSLGRVVAHRLEDGQAIATVALSENPDYAGLITDIRTGISKAVSVGYDILAWEEEDLDGKMIRRITKWSPFEISLVNVPADIKAQIRSVKTDPKPAAPSGSTKPALAKEKRMSMKRKAQRALSKAKRLATRAQRAMTEVDSADVTELQTAVSELEAASEAVAAIAEGAVEGEDAEKLADAVAELEDASEAVSDLTEDLKDSDGSDDDAGDTAADAAAERSRASAIVKLAKRHGMADDFAETHISKGSTVEAVQKAILETRAANSPEIGARSRVIRDAAETQSRAMRDALFSRLSGTEAKDEARAYRSLSLFEMAKRSLGAEFTNADQATVYRAINAQTRGFGAMTTGDLGTLGALGGAIDKRLKELVSEDEREYEPITRRSTVRNFMPQATISAASFPGLKLVPENGQIEFGTAGSEGKQFNIAKYGRKIAFTFEAFVNDDLRYIDAILRSTTGVSAKLERNLVWGAVNGNAKMGDGTPLFHASRKNIITDPLSVAGVQKANVILRRQEDHEGTPMGLRGRVLIVAPELELVANQMITPVVAVEAANVNPFAGRLTVIVDDNLSGTEWKLMAGLAGDHVELAELEGYQGLHTEQEYDPNISATVYYAKKYVGADLTGWRGWVKSTGTGA